MEKTIHHGRNIKRFREMFGIKQEALALELNEIYPHHGEAAWNQKKISLLEGKEKIDDELLEEVAKVLKVPGEAIRNFDEEAAVNIISNTFHDSSYQNGSVNYYPTFNPIDKIVDLYERMLKEKDEKILMLERRPES